MLNFCYYPNLWDEGPCLTTVVLAPGACGMRGPSCGSWHHLPTSGRSRHEFQKQRSCAPAADFVAIDFATLRRFTYFLESRATVTQLSGLVGPGPGSATVAKSIKNMQVFKHFSKNVIKTCRFSYFFRDRGSKSSPLGPSRSTFMRRLRTW